MKKSYQIVLSVALVGVACVQAPAATLTERDFFSKPSQTGFGISADGRWLSWLQPVQGKFGGPQRLNIFVQPLQAGSPTGSAKQLTFESDRDVGSHFATSSKQYLWKGGSTILYRRDIGGDENFHILAVNVTTGRSLDLTPFDGIQAEVVDLLPRDAHHVLIQHNRRNKKVKDVYRVDVRTGAYSLVARNPGGVLEWTTDHAGKVRGALAADGSNQVVLYRPTENSPWRALVTTDFRIMVRPEFFDFDNRSLFALSNRGRDRQALVKIDPARPEIEKVVWEHPSVDLDRVTYLRARQKLATVEFHDALPGRHIFDRQTQQTFDQLHRRLPDYSIEFQGITDNEEQMVLLAYNDRTEGTYYLWHKKNETLTQLAVVNPKLPEAAMAPMRPIRYQSRDGLEIHGYLTLPVGKEPKNLACVVNPHGGPWHRDKWGFNAEVQFLAHNGYCVLQMNFRGSTGYGRRFWEASFGQWGLKMQDDITDGVKWLTEQGIADPKRIGIYGASYGGYATLAGISYTPDLYAAAVDYVGVSNLTTFLNSIPPYWEPMRRQMYAMVGNPEDPQDKARLVATSPVFHTEKIKTPLFVAQGARDPRVNKAESDQIVEALRKNGVSVEYMLKDNEGHGFNNEENSLDFYRTMITFFKRHINPQDAGK